MNGEVRVPKLPESIADAQVLRWHKQPGEAVQPGETLVDLETDKVVLEVPAPEAGMLAEILAPEGQRVAEDQVLARLTKLAETEPTDAPRQEEGTARSARSEKTEEPRMSPAARRLIKELHLDPSRIPGTGKEGRIQKIDVIAFLDRQEKAQSLDPETVSLSQPPEETEARPERRVPMTRIRARIAERLVQAQQTAALLTTFNEVNMQPVMDLRAKYRETFERVHGVRLGYLSFFVKAVVAALQRFPVINASIDGEEIVYHGYYDIGIAVSSPRGLVVPILRDCDQLSMADIEKGIDQFAKKAKKGTLSLEELSGGTFSITNGGVFGSLLSTPILNPPQSAILGMHRIQERPVAEGGEIRIRPMMYLALSYDHRLIDGKEAVQFLVAVKESLEDPARLILEI